MKRAQVDKRKDPEVGVRSVEAGRGFWEGDAFNVEKG
jgi:hypothetical protein